ncbi:MAG: hypothetical protein DLM61_19955 [Pseudonocardiales bacterium]|nr:MAG: hypothetical protein DLM61_19955 [Pseudonocardiales bacterium]
MTDEFTYTPEQALARSILLTAVNGGINHWARVHGFTVDCPPEQVRAEGIDTVDGRSLWHVDLDDIQLSITKLIEQPEQCAAPDSGIDFEQLHAVGESLTDAITRRLNDLADIQIIPARHADKIHLIIADHVFQVAVAGEVIY